ncbi:hypothetical protein [Variovorax sp. LjRoot178]|uniref:hypothetical protein n=1 Tax=Variovorax sp. LjRoot178 TaxID=3342277 RepID=UPI003F51817A
MLLLSISEQQFRDALSNALPDCGGERLVAQLFSEHNPAPGMTLVLRFSAGAERSDAALKPCCNGSAVATPGSRSSETYEHR